ncbi:hypothetical protein ARC20_17300 [Stenotrophomonas panacihumi]|uniref:Uncharacterized protein n=1 Tax=Stenotrophomonas panacihumi TaxID=676599 RepID=A0A0R0ATQ7_9GAMM|nr:hypothetical protein ARC20_17300 [Stenotrophomonas panacihumi]
MAWIARDLSVSFELQANEKIHDLPRQDASSRRRALGLLQERLRLADACCQLAKLGILLNPRNDWAKLTWLTFKRQPERTECSLPVFCHSLISSMRCLCLLDPPYNGKRLFNR